MKVGELGGNEADLRPYPVLLSGVDADLMDVADDREASGAREVGNARTGTIYFGGGCIYQGDDGEEVCGEKQRGLLECRRCMVYHCLDGSFNHGGLMLYLLSM